jgi:hypothetical protein
MIDAEFTALDMQDLGGNVTAVLRPVSRLSIAQQNTNHHRSAL